MNKLYCLIIFVFACRICEGQNLVPNGDFEQYSSCPTAISQLDTALFWMNPEDPSFGATPDYFNQCANVATGVSVPDNGFGNQQAHNGVAYSGIFLKISGIVDAREYIEVPLISTLVANTCYHFEMYVNLSDFSKYTTDAIGIYFSDTVVTGLPNAVTLPFVPQINNDSGNYFDNSNWVLVEGNYTASGNENYLIIGNYKNDANTDTILINNGGAGWLYCYVDDVSLSVCTGVNELNQDEVINIYPNPTTDKLNVTINNNELSQIILFDVVSRKLFHQSFTNSISINTEQLVKGIYLYEVRNKNGVIKKGKVVKD